jgi:serine/threonine-protein kinase
MKLGRYRILRQIGAGGQANVLLAHDPRLRRLVALKLHGLRGVGSRRSHALREARRAAQLDSPYIPRVHDVQILDDDLLVIMQYVRGCDLADVLRQTRLSLQSCLAIASDVAAALSCAHRGGVVHGDLKPGNVLIADSGRAMLADFGVAVALGQQGVGGSVSALTPEHLRGEPLLPASDLFSLGVLLYRMISGEHPFAPGESGREAMLAGRFTPLSVASRNPDVSDTLDALVASLMAPDPRRRPLSLHAVRQSLRDISRHQPLGDAGSLLQETQPYFRAEARSDLPDRLALRLPNASRTERYWYRLQSLLLRYPGRAVALACVMPLLLFLVGWLRPPHCIALYPPEVTVSGSARGFTPGLDRDWLQAQLQQALERDGRRTAPFAAGLRAGPEPDLVCAPTRQVGLHLECRDSLCLLSLGRDGEVLGTGVALFADAPLDVWARAVRQALTQSRLLAAGAASDAQS